jgi:myosin heavy subunit
MIKNPISAPEVVVPQVPRVSGLALDRQLLELQEEHDQVLDGMAIELEDAELKLETKIRELSQAQDENTAWQEFACRITQDLEGQKGGPPTQTDMVRRPYGKQERASLYADFQQLLEALRMTQDVVDVKEREQRAINEKLTAKAHQVETLRNELSSVQRSLATQQKQRASVDQVDDLRRRCDFFKSNSEQLSQQVRDLQAVNEGMKDAARAKDSQLRELQSLLSTLNHKYFE